MDRISEAIAKIKKVDEGLIRLAQSKLDNLTKPQGSLGKLEELARRMVAITESTNPRTERKVIFTMAGDHGVATEGVSAYPSEVTPQMVYNFIAGGAGVNVLARHVGAKVLVVDMGVAADFDPAANLIIKKIAHGTKNIAKGPAMSREEAQKTVEAGSDVFNEELNKHGIDIVGTGDMGIANTTPSSAIICAVTGKDPSIIAGRGTGIDDLRLKLKIDVIRKALEVNKPDIDDPLDLLAKVGGFEIGGIAGLILAAASNRIPVVVDGFISTAGALIATRFNPAVTDYMFMSHNSAEKGHLEALDFIGIEPILDLDMRLGEGTGAALAIGIIEASVKILTEMATFGEAGVSNRND
ncbi:MAG: nicotinate-nucleotide--dimethylbenzimidazole phosphoribosyltransferase [Actinobacteria bacterium]|nr:nicotinate-nucleotide--dimethylbenzimidazole phosphoribosyltransferase [Actinomycetota bacterium]